MISEEKVAKTICSILNQVGNLGSYDSVPSFDDFNFVSNSVDPAQKIPSYLLI